jgi:hypothetical protein
VLRKTMARVVTIEQACRREGVDTTELLAELRNVEISDNRVNTELVVPYSSCNLASAWKTPRARSKIRMLYYSLA